MNKKFKIKLVGLLIILSVILYPLLISCGDNQADNFNNNQPPVNDADNNTDNNENLKNPSDVISSLEELYSYPDHDFEGAEINVLARRDGWYDGSQDIEDISVESLTGEVLNDAVYARTKKVEGKYNVLLKMTYMTEPTDAVSKSVKSGDDEYQMVQDKLMFMSQTLVPQNYLLDLKPIPGINLDAPWYNQNAIKNLSINNKIAVLGGDMIVNDKGGVIMITFSKKLSAQYGLENLYATVRDGKWTLDKMYELIIQTTADLNGDGQLTFNDDQWGLVCEDYGGWMLAAGCGNRLADLDNNGIPYITCLSEKSVSNYEKIKTIMYEKSGRVEVSEDAEHVRIFMENRCFLNIDMLSSIAMMRGMEEDFGIIPMPKYDEVQSDYIATISPWVSRFIAIPSSCGNPEMVGVIIDALSRESAAGVVPAYYDNLLNQKIARDEESIEMLKQIFDSVIYDIGSVFNWGSIWDQQHTFFSSKNQDYVSFHEKIMGRIETALNKTIETMHQFD